MSICYYFQPEHREATGHATASDEVDHLVNDLLAQPFDLSMANLYPSEQAEDGGSSNSRSALTRSEASAVSSTAVLKGAGSARARPEIMRKWCTATSAAGASIPGIPNSASRRSAKPPNSSSPHPASGPIPLIGSPSRR